MVLRNGVTSALLRKFLAIFDEEFDECGRRCYKWDGIRRLTKKCTAEAYKKRHCFIRVRFERDVRNLLTANAIAPDINPKIVHLDVVEFYPGK